VPRLPRHAATNGAKTELRSNALDGAILRNACWISRYANLYEQCSRARAHARARLRARGPVTRRLMLG